METSERIVESLRGEPGLSAAGVARCVGIDPSTAGYHLRRLEREGKISSAGFGRETVWYAGGCGLCPVLKRALPAMRRAGVAPVALAVSEAPCTIPQIAAETGLTRGEVAWALKVLRDAGVVRRSATGKAQLVEGAEECVARSLAQEPCPLWGACAPSRVAVITDPRPSSWRP